MTILLDLVSASHRTKSIARAQRDLNTRLLQDGAFARQQSMLPLHAELGVWISPSVGRRVLELGCGPGRYVGLLAALGFKVEGVDPFPFEFWNVLRARSDVHLRDNVFAEKLPFPDGSFDHVCCLGALLYFQNVDDALSEVRRVLRPGGRMVLRSVNRNNLYTASTGRKLDPASKNLYTLNELEEMMLRHGFAVSRSFQYGYYPPAFADFYWYLANVHLSAQCERWLSDRLPPDRRVNNIVHVTRV